MAERAKTGRGLLYLRQSQGEPTLVQSQYVSWAQGRATELGVAFMARPTDVDLMLRAGQSARGDLFVDWNISGNILRRPGFDAFRGKALSDLSVSHLFVTRRDRIARADNPIDAVSLEIELRSAGLTIVFQDGVAETFPKGHRFNIGDLLTMVVDYDKSGAFRTELASKLISVKVKLAECGYAIGGEAPYGFRRWLCTAAGVQQRELTRGETVKWPGHHVIWLPSCEAEMAIVRRILDLIRTAPASKIAAMLNAEGVPSPRAGCSYTPKGGRPVPRSGLWYPTTIRNIVTNPALVSLMSYGKRSSGDAMRFTPKGPRPLDARDYDCGVLKQIANPEADWLVTRIPGDRPTVIGEQERREIVAIVEARGSTQRGKPRAKGSNPNPLGARIFDMNCGWLMYRKARRGGWKYCCGLNTHSDSQRCDHNAVDGVAATRFVVAAARQVVLSDSAEAKLRARLEELAAAERGIDPAGELRADLEAKLKVLKVEVDGAQRRMTLEQDEEIAGAMKLVYKDWRALQARFQAELADVPATAPSDNPEIEVEKALDYFRRLRDPAAESDPAMAGATSLMKVIDAKLYISFHKVKKGRRTFNLPQSGVVTFGNVAPPVPIWEGRTDRASIKIMLTEGQSVSAGASIIHCESGDSGTVVGRSGNMQRVTKRCTRPAGHVGFF